MVRTCRRFPPNWQNVIPISNVVENTRFIVFKTPVDAKCGLRVRKEQRFNTSDLLFQITQRGQQLGLIINLSYSTRYYDSGAFDSVAAYKHIPCTPAGYTRREDLVKKFIATVDSFLKNHKDDDLLIGVHCSDGINRSGYLICRYLIDRLHMGSDAALDAFEKARGHTIERGSCVQALHRAVADRRNKELSPIEHFDSDEEKKPRKRKGDVSHGDEMLQQLAMLEQEFSQPTAEAMDSQSWGTPDDRKPVSIGPQVMPKRKKYDVEDGEYMEADEYYEEEEEGFEEGEGDKISTAKQRRLRRKKLTKKFNIMKTGKFHLIQEVLRED